jgi:hypothetical protein
MRLMCQTLCAALVLENYFRAPNRSECDFLFQALLQRSGAVFSGNTSGVRLFLRVLSPLLFKFGYRNFSSIT